MTEVQEHGFSFENKIREALKAEDKQTYTSKWDVEEQDKKISIKCMGRDNALELSSLMRFYEAEPFTMIIGRWEQVDAEHKQIVGIDVLEFTEEVFNNLRGTFTISEIKETVAMLTVANFPYGKDKEAREWFKNWKKENKSKMGLLTFTGKVDSLTQRRWQCSINNTNYRKLFGQKSSNTMFNGVDFSEPFYSPPRNMVN